MRLFINLATFLFFITLQFLQIPFITCQYCVWYPYYCCYPDYNVGGNCYSSCSYPLYNSSDSTGEQYCKTPCSGQYAYWDGSCGSTCGYTNTYHNYPAVYATSESTYAKCIYPCGSSQYLYWNNSCLSSCTYPLVSVTYKSRNFCAYPCAATQYLYFNQSCLNTCPYPLSPEIQGTYLSRKFCWYACMPSQWLSWDQTCQENCTAPLWPEIQGTTTKRQFCWYPCTSEAKFLYWNASCLAECPEPLSTRYENGQWFCDYPCTDLTQYLYWNKSCLGNCPSPLFNETQGTYLPRKFCWYPCQPSQFLLSDGSCVDSCPSGYFENTALHDCQLCQDSLCSDCSTSLGTQCQLCKDPYILSSNGICQDCQAIKSEYIKQIDETYTYQYKLRLLPASCDLDEITVQQYLSPTQDSKNLFPPFSFQVNQTQDSTGAKYFLLEIQFQSAISSTNSLTFTLGSLRTDLSVPKTSTTKTQPTADQGVKATFAAVTGSTVGAGLTLGATAALWSIISFQQFVGYFIYLNIQLPPHLIYFLTMFDNVSLEILPNPLASLTEQFAELWDSLVNNTDKKYQLPHKFTEFDTPTLFVINAGSTFFVCIILLLVPYLFDFLRKFKFLQGVKFIQNLHSSLRWNIPIRIFLESGIPLTFALLIQMRKISYSNVPYGISTFTASLAFIYLGMMINSISQALRDFKYEDLQNPNVENSIGTLFEGIVLKKEKPSGKYYYLLILSRGMLLIFVDVLVDQFPTVQTTLMAVFNMFFVYFVWKVIKFQSRYLNWTNRIKEILILITELFFMTLCYQQNEEYRNIVGWLVIVMLGTALAMELLFGFYLQILAVRDLMKRIREYYKKKKQTKVVTPMPNEETSRNVLTTEVELKTDLTFIS